MPPSSTPVNAVIVAYNRPDSLVALVDALRAQTHPLTSIFVIDNSTDCRCRDAVHSRDGKGFQYVPMGANTGSAGGFERGIREAEHGAEFLWLFDDDMTVEPDALAGLLRWVPDLSAAGRIGALRSWYRGRTAQAAPWPMQDFAWRGTLISTEAVRAVGYPDGRLFLYADDVDYSLRIARAGFAMYYVPGSFMSINAPATKHEFTVAGLGVSYHDSPLRLYYAVRNEIVVSVRHGLLLRAVRVVAHAAKVAVAVIAFEAGARAAFLSALGRGLADGLRGRLGRHPRY